MKKKTCKFHYLKWGKDKRMTLVYFVEKLLFSASNLGADKLSIW